MASTEAEAALQNLRKRWPDVNWALDYEESTSIAIKAKIEGVFIWVDGYKHRKPQCSWEAQVDGALRDWYNRFESPVMAVQAALNSVKAAWKIWEQIAPGLKEDPDQHDDSLNGGLR